MESVLGVADRQRVIAVGEGPQLRRDEGVARHLGHDLEDAGIDLLDPGQMPGLPGVELDILDHERARPREVDFAALSASRVG